MLVLVVILVTSEYVDDGVFGVFTSVDDANKAFGEAYGARGEFVAEEDITQNDWVWFVATDENGSETRGYARPMIVR